MTNLIPKGFIDFGGTRVAVDDISTYHGYPSYSHGLTVELTTKSGKIHIERNVVVADIDKRIRLTQEATNG